MRLTTSSSKKKFVENLLREKNARRGQGSMGCGATDDDDEQIKEGEVCGTYRERLGRGGMGNEF
jgi:hypothetical protein